MFKLSLSPKSIPALLTASAALLMLNSCGTHRTALRQTTPAAIPQDQEAAQIAEQSYSYWSDQEDRAPLTVRIDLSEQTANFYRNVGKIPNPGSPASHGCVRMPTHMARTLFQNAPTGTTVVIVQ
jgi:hypothetical protein